MDPRAEDHCRYGENCKVEDGGGALAVGTGMEFYVEDGDVTVEGSEESDPVPNQTAPHQFIEPLSPTQIRLC